MPSGSRPARLIETPSAVERIVVNAFVFDQFTDCGSEIFPCSPSMSYALRATLRTHPHCIGPKTTFEALNSRYPNCLSR